jgi:hypothetical protein
MLAMLADFEFGTYIVFELGVEMEGWAKGVSTAGERARPVLAFRVRRTEGGLLRFEVERSQDVLVIG